MAGTAIKSVGNNANVNVQIPDMVTAAKQNAGTRRYGIRLRTMHRRPIPQPETVHRRDAMMSDAENL